MSCRAVLRLILLVSFSSLVLRSGQAQSSYLTDVGIPTYATTQPTQAGQVDVSNGNLHLDIPIYAGKQRGNLSPMVDLLYDSKLWKIVESNGSYSWQPVNAASAAYDGAALEGGWRYSLGDAGNQSGQIGFSNLTIPCYFTWVISTT